ncbi:MAG: hypothetical protein ACOCV1_05370 [Bacillota bacterium]
MIKIPSLKELKNTESSKKEGQFMYCRPVVYRVYPPCLGDNCTGTIGELYCKTHTTSISFSTIVSEYALTKAEEDEIPLDPVYITIYRKCDCNTTKWVTTASGVFTYPTGSAKSGSCINSTSTPMDIADIPTIKECTVTTV